MTNAKSFGAQSTTDDVLEGVDLRGKRILVTGVSAGLGVETARALAAHGAQVVGAARDLAKAETATAPVRAAAANGGGLELIELVLASLAEAYYWSGRVDEAAEALEFALRCESGEEKPYVHGLYGVVLFDQGDREGAAEHLLEAYKLAGDDSIPHDDPKYRVFRDGLPAFKALRSGAGPS